MTDKIAHPPMPEAAAHMCQSDLVKFQTGERTATAFSVAVVSPDDRSAPLFTEQQMREHCEVVALPLLAACRSAIYAIRGREHDGFLRDAITQAAGERP